MARKGVYLSFLFLLLNSLFAGWIVLNPPGQPIPGAYLYISSFSFITPDTGYIVRPSATIEGSFAFWKTTNGGLSFQNVTPPETGCIRGECWGYSSCQFFQDVGYLYTLAGPHIDDTPYVRLWRTTDGGNSWETVLLLKVNISS